LTFPHIRHRAVDYFGIRLARRPQRRHVHGNVVIASSGASNTPFAVAVMFTVTQPACFNDLAAGVNVQLFRGRFAPAVQTVSITNTARDADFFRGRLRQPYWWLFRRLLAALLACCLSRLTRQIWWRELYGFCSGQRGRQHFPLRSPGRRGTQPLLYNHRANAGSFQSGVASATWVAILGSNLSTTTYTWQASDFVNGMLPTSLQEYRHHRRRAGVRPIHQSDADQCAGAGRCLDRPGPDPGDRAQQASNTVTVQKSAFSPALFTIDNGSMWLRSTWTTRCGQCGASAGVTTTPAQAGEPLPFMRRDSARQTRQLHCSVSDHAHPWRIRYKSHRRSERLGDLRGISGSGTYQLT